jgi:tRNA A-37 threonylcarbamoyl transferase component Bud32
MDGLPVRTAAPPHPLPGRDVVNAKFDTGFPPTARKYEVVLRLWDAGLAHRDIKPANLLVRDHRMLLIDVAFVQARPSPWRQAVDLANMMLCLALRSSPEQVY